MSDSRDEMPQAGLLERLGAGLRRVRGANERPNEKGIRTIWHHGPQKTDLFSFLGPDRSLTRQELVFLDRAVGWSRSRGLETGRLGDTGTPSAPGSSTIDYAAEGQDHKSLMEASLILRSVPNPDYYTQHLRREVNDYLRNQGDPATAVGNIDPELQAELRRLYEISQEVATVPPLPDEDRADRLRLMLVVLGGAAGGALVVYVLWSLFS